MPGIRIAHRTLKACVALVPLVHKPFTGQSLDLCPTCQIIHPVKTVHLWLDDAGQCLVSQGVLDDLRLAGMPNLEIMGHTNNPPPLRLGNGATREQLDQANRLITVWTKGDK